MTTTTHLPFTNWPKEASSPTSWVSIPFIPIRIRPARSSMRSLRERSTPPSSGDLLRDTLCFINNVSLCRSLLSHPARRTCLPPSISPWALDWATHSSKLNWRRRSTTSGLRFREYSGTMEYLLSTKPQQRRAHGDPRLPDIPDAGNVCDRRLSTRYSERSGRGTRLFGDLPERL